ncbi:YuzL family protein [Microbacteriaceae bacterium 4G12]
MMGKRKQDGSKGKLDSAHVEGQGTTNRETGAVQASSSRHKQKQS